MRVYPARRRPLSTLLSQAGLSTWLFATALGAQTGGSTLPATLPTQPAIAPLAATAGATTGERSRAARVTCEGGQLTIAADDSSLNQILHAVARCTGMRITGAIAEQRVFGNYGPAAPATVLATLIDGTGSNMVLLTTADNQPSELILTPRTGGGVTPPPASSYNEADDNGGPATTPLGPPQAAPPSSTLYGLRRGGRPSAGFGGGQDVPAQGAANQTPVPQPNDDSVVTGPSATHEPLNNVNGSSSNVSPTPGTYPTTNSVPLDAVATPSTTPSTSGIVDAPNPPPAGSDTAAALSGAPKGTPGTTNIDPDATSQTSTPGGTNTTVPSDGGQTSTTGQSSQDLTPEQVFQQLQQRQQQQQQQQQQGANPQ